MTLEHEFIIPPSWRGDQVGTLVFVVDGGSLVLIEKKRGHGAGKVNAPGGKLEAGETPLECARRETREEVGLECGRLRLAATLRFHDTVTGFDMLVYGFTCRDYEGTAVETAEAKPFWCRLDEIPYHRMWQDDAVWLPMILAGARVRGDFAFADDALVRHEVVRITPTTEENGP